MNQPAREQLMNQRERPPGAPPPLFAEVVTRYETPLLRYVGRFLSTGAAEAEDIVQETFLRYHRQVTQHGADSVKETGAWLYRAAHNLSIDALRKRRRTCSARERFGAPLGVAPAQDNLQAGGLRHNDAPDALDEMIRRESSDLVLAELHRLPDHLRQVLLLRVVQGMKLAEISAVTGLTIGNAGYRISQGLNELARRLKAAGVT